MVRRLKSELKDWDGTPRFPPRKIKVIQVAYTEEERRIHERLQAYTRLRQDRASKPVERTATDFVLKLLKKRLFSSPQAFLNTLEKHRQSLMDDREKHPGEQRAVRHSRHKEQRLRAMIEELETDAADNETLSENLWEAMRESARAMPPLTEEEAQLLDEMMRWARRAAQRADSKAQKLFQWLDEHIRPGGEWSNERVIIFTEYRDTQTWLHRQLYARGFIQGERTLLLYGGMAEEERERIKAAFQARPEDSPVRILLATDAASEGIDLQRHCHQLIHYEIPWNPNRLEQRNGRIDRHGQKHSPLIYHFVPAGFQQRQETGGQRTLEWELEFLSRVVEKVGQIRADLGNVGPVVAAQVNEAMLGRRDHLNPDEETDRTRPAREILKFQRDLSARIEKLRQKLQETRQVLDLTPENVRDVVQIALELAGQPRLRETDMPGVFHVPALRGSWQDAMVGLEHPYTGKRRPIVFDAQLASGRDDVVLAHLNHPLVQRALRLLRAEVWRTGGVRHLHRVTARTIPRTMADTPIVVAHARLVMTGKLGHRLHEEVLTVGGEIREGRFRRLGVTRVAELLQAATDEEPSPEVLARLQGVWPRIESALQRAVEVRGQERTDSLRKKLAEREQKEIQDMRAILEELAATIQRELDQPEFVQLSLFSRTEQEQYSRNQRALQARLRAIPEEIQRETEAIHARYADPAPRVFPIAITFLVPQSVR